MTQKFLNYAFDRVVNKFDRNLVSNGTISDLSLLSCIKQ